MTKILAANGVILFYQTDWNILKTKQMLKKCKIPYITGLKVIISIVDLL